MRKLFLRSKLLLSLSVIALFISAPAFAQVETKNFILRNETGVEVNSLYVSPHDSKNWEDDILGQETLASGQSVKIVFDDRGKKVKWDLKVTDKNGNSLEWENLNLIEIAEVTLHWDGKKKQGWVDVK